MKFRQKRCSPRPKRRPFGERCHPQPLHSACLVGECLKLIGSFEPFGCLGQMAADAGFHVGFQDLRNKRRKEFFSFPEVHAREVKPLCSLTQFHGRHTNISS